MQIRWRKSIASVLHHNVFLVEMKFWYNEVKHLFLWYMYDTYSCTHNFNIDIQYFKVQINANIKQREKGITKFGYTSRL